MRRLSPQVANTCGFDSGLTLSSAMVGSRRGILFSVQAVSSHDFNCDFACLTLYSGTSNLKHLLMGHLQNVVQAKGSNPYLLPFLRVHLD